jgi:Fe-S-cluster-containing dehydrogenase component
MDNADFFLIVRCLECVQDGCVVVCGNEALSFISGDLLIDRQKCSECVSFNLKHGVPVCIADCEHAVQKAIITKTAIEDKRTQAVNAMSLF